MLVAKYSVLVGPARLAKQPPALLPQPACPTVVFRDHSPRHGSYLLVALVNAMPPATQTLPHCGTDESRKRQFVLLLDAAELPAVVVLPTFGATDRHGTATRTLAAEAAVSHHFRRGKPAIQEANARRASLTPRLQQQPPVSHA